MATLNKQDKEPIEHVIHALYSELEELDDFIQKQPKGLRFANSDIAFLKHELMCMITHLRNRQFATTLRNFSAEIKDIRLPAAEALVLVLNDIATSLTPQD